jgi:hypothetical protein
MTPLSRKIAAALDAAPDLGPLPRRFEVEDSGRRLSLNLTAAGPVGLAFDHLEFQAGAAAEHSTEALRARADAISKRVTYLMEPLVVLEIDPLAGEVELRSQSPTERGVLKSYYEVRLNKQGTVRLSRVVFDATRHRRAVPCQMTLEVLERLVDDLIACLD